MSYSIIDEISEGLPIWHYSGATKLGGKDGLLVKFANTLVGDWVGVFAFGYRSSTAISVVYSCPNRSRLCVVARGQGVIVCSDNPLSHEVIDLLPIMGVFPIPSPSLLVVHDFTRFVAYGTSGFLWETPSLSWDGIKSISVGNGVIRGMGWDVPTGKDIDFQISLRDGTFKGGSSPDLIS